VRGFGLGDISLMRISDLGGYQSWRISDLGGYQSWRISDSDSEDIRLKALKIFNTALSYNPSIQTPCCQTIFPRNNHNHNPSTSHTPHEHTLSHPHLSST
jgi:hypothetical protein